MVTEYLIAVLPQAFYWDVVFYSNIPSHIIRLKLILLYSLLSSLSISLIRFYDEKKKEKASYLADMLPSSGDLSVLLHWKES